MIYLHQDVVGKKVNQRRNSGFNCIIQQPVVVYGNKQYQYNENQNNRVQNFVLKRQFKIFHTNVLMGGILSYIV